ncbi:beta strand repeat-containing protein [Streptomyces sp. NPDC085466]|uniref:beta strand repeat-containing protein n=1 Tax=Streptomyces sp. NPDC085466 TaxID=3365725 RepID=UPI0037CEE332
MARRHTTGWEVLGFGEDPTPGNPEAIRTLAGTYRELGDGAGEAVDLLRDDGAIRRGKGQAMDALKGRIGKDLPGLLEKTRDSFRTAAGAYEEYATTLTEAQSMLDRAIDQGQEVAGTAGTEVPALPPDATPEQAEAHQTRQGEVNAAKEQLSAAVALGRDARRLREDGSQKASVILDDAAEQAIPARDFIKAFGDFLADNPLVEIIAGILIGIIAVFLPVVGLILGAVLFAVSVIRMVSQGKIDAGDIIIGLLTLVPGGVLLGGLGKVVAAAGKLAKFAPFLAKVGKGVGTTSAAVTIALKGSTFARKIIDPLGKGLVGIKTSPVLALGAKFTIDASTEFALGLAASGLTALFDGKKFDVANAAKGAALGAATAGALTVIGGTKFANSVKDAFIVKDKFKSNIDKAFSLESLGVSGGQFKPSGILFVDTKGMGQKTGFHGINGVTKSDPSTGEVKTKVTTPDGTKTETKITPPASKPDQAPPADDFPFAPPAADTTSTTTTTPDGFTSTTKDGTNTITSPAGDTITSNGTTTTIDTPIAGPTFKEKAVGVFAGEFAPAPSAKPALSTELGPGGTFTTSGPFGAVSKDAGGTTTFSSPGDGAPTPEFTVNNNTITTPGGLTVTDNGGSTSVGGGGVHVDNQNGVTSVFGNPAGGGQPVAVHNPVDGSVDVNFGNTTVSVPGHPGGGATLPDGTQVSVGAGGAVNVTNGDGGGQTVTLPAFGAGGPLTVTDGTVTTAIPPAGGATVTTPGGPVTTLNDTGFTVDTGGPRPDILQFNGPGGTLDVTPPGGQPQVSVGAGGGVTTGGITTDGTGGGTATGGDGTIAFSPAQVTLGTPDGASLSVDPQGRFDVSPAGDGPPLTISPAGDITVSGPGTAGVTFTTPDGGTVGTAPGGGLDVTPSGGQPQVSVGAGGGVTTGGITTDGTGGGTATGGGGTIAFSPFGITFNAPDGTSLSLNSNGRFHVDGIGHGADGVTIAGSTTVEADGSASIAHGGQEIHVGPGGTLTANDAQGNPVAPSVPQPTPGNAVDIGNTTISVDGTGGHTVTVHGNSGTTVTIAQGTTTIHSGPLHAVHGPNGITGTVSGPQPIQAGQSPNGVTTVSQGGTTVTTSAGGPTTAGPQGQPPTVTVEGPAGTTPAQVTTADGSTTAVHADGTVTKSAPAGSGPTAPGHPVTTAQTVTVGGAGHPTTVTVGSDGTTVSSGPLQASHGPHGTTGSAGTVDPVHAAQSPGGATTVSHNGTSVGTSADGPTTIGPQGQPPSVTVAPATAGGPTQITTPGGSASTLTGDGAQTSVNGAGVASSAVHQDGSVTTQAPAGPHTTVTHGPNGTAATDNGGAFGADHTGTVTSGPVTVTAGTGAGNTPVATLTDTTAGGAQADVTPQGIDSQGITTTTGPDGGVTFTHQPAGGGTTTVTSGPDGTITTQNPDGSGAHVPPRPAPAPGGVGPLGAPAATTVTNGNGAALSTDGQTLTYESNGVTTTLGNDGNGPTTTTVHHESGVGHTVDGNGQATVHNAPSDATITATHTQVTVNTPQQEGWGLLGSPDMTGGQNTLSNGPNGPTITTHGADPISEPGSTVVHGPNRNGPEGEISVTYGPATGTFAPGGVTGLGPSGTHLDPATNTPIDTAGNPLGDGPGQTSVNTVGGDGHSGITVPTPGGGPTLHHDGFFGGGTTVTTGGTTLSKSPGDVENAGTAGQKAGVVDGPHNPLDPAPAPGPETFTVGGDGGPSLDVPVGGKDGSTVHGGPFDVKATGDGTVEVSVAGGGNGPNDKVAIGPDGTLQGPGVTAPAQPGGPQQITLSDGTTVTGGPGTQAVVTPPGGAGPTTTVTQGTATTTDPAGGVTITQNADGTATYTGTAAGETTTLTITPDGVKGTVTTTGPGGVQATFHVDLKNNGAVQITDADGTTVNELDAAGSYNEQHTPIHDYHAHTGGPTSVTDLREYGYEALTSILKGAVSQAVSVGYQVGANGADAQTALENAGIRLGYGVGNSLAGKKIENDYGFKTKGPEVPLASLPQKTLGGLNANQDTALANPPEEAPLKV